MPRKQRVQFEGAIYHVTQRGAGRGLIFQDDADRQRFLARLGEAVEEDGVRLYLYCLMPNHFHLLLETPRANLAAFMHRLQTAYTLYYNARHGRSGHLMQGRYGAEPVGGDRYLLNLSRYVHLNPVAKADVPRPAAKVRAARLREYVWSSYRGYAGFAPPENFVDEKPMLALMGSEKIAAQREAYRRFVESGLATAEDEPKPEPGGAGEVYSGKHSAGSRSKDTAFRRRASRVAPEDILKRVAAEFGVGLDEIEARTYAGWARSAAAWMLVRHARLTQREVAGRLGLGSGAAVCVRISRMKAKAAAEPEWAARIEKLSRSLGQAD